MSDPFAPSFGLTVQDNRVSETFRGLVQSMEYESTDGMADMFKLVIADPLNSLGKMPIRESKLFMPGNEISAWFGYGSNLGHVGRSIIRRVKPNFPSNGTPTIEITAYDASSMMADSAPEPLKETKVLKRGGRRVKNSKAGRKWTNARYSDAVRDRAEAYGFQTDIDATLEPPSDFIQKAKMTDFDFIQGLSNLTGFYWWVDGEPGGDWTLHFRNPETISKADLQEKEYTFKYGDGDFTTLIDFQPELAIQGAISKILVQTKDPVTGQVIEAKIEEEDDPDVDTTVTPGNVRNNTDLAGNQRDAMPANQKFEGSIQVASDVKVFIDDYSFGLHATRRFRNAADLAGWAASWFRRNRENFMLSSGTLIGNETLRARQQHKLVGLGSTYDGLYYFSRVRHIFTATGGYTVDFSARRTVATFPPITSASELQVVDLLAKKGNI